MKSRSIEKVLYIIKILIAAPIAFIYKKKLKKQSIWLIGIEYDRYENNCKDFFEYLLNKGENVYWVFSKKNLKRFLEVIPEEKRLYRGTIKNYIFAFYAHVGAYSASDFDLAPGLYRVFGRKSCLINLSHGYDAIKMMDLDYYKKMPSDIIVCASKNERSIKIENFSADPDKAFVTGFARCDGFICSDNNKIKNIMIMPTWRDWYIKENINFQDSFLYKAYGELLKKIDNMVNKMPDIQVYFLLHPVMADYFEQKPIYESKSITYIFQQSMVSHYLKISDLLITDYSSISFDYIYMKKPIIYFWFDYEEYKAKRGLFMDKDSFERICFDGDAVINNLKEILKSDKKYSERDRSLYWDFFDNHNCERIYKTITSHKKYKAFVE